MIQMALKVSAGMGLVVLVLGLALLDGAVAQMGCTQALMGLSPCLNYVTGNSSNPTASCCSQLARVVRSQPQCLCSLLNTGAAALGININQTLAMGLPNVCNVQTPPVSQCNGAAGPTTSTISPASSPTADSSDQNPETQPTSSIPTMPSGTGSKTVPTKSGSTSIHKLSLLTVIFFTACVSKILSF